MRGEFYFLRGTAAVLLALSLAACSQQEYRLTRGSDGRDQLCMRWKRDWQPVELVPAEGVSGVRLDRERPHPVSGTPRPALLWTGEGVEHEAELSFDDRVLVLHGDDLSLVPVDVERGERALLLLPTGEALALQEPGSQVHQGAWAGTVTLSGRSSRLELRVWWCVANRESAQELRVDGQRRPLGEVVVRWDDHGIAEAILRTGDRGLELTTTQLRPGSPLPLTLGSGGEPAEVVLDPS